MRDNVTTTEDVVSGYAARVQVHEAPIRVLSAQACIEHRNAAGELLDRQVTENVKTTVGIDFLHTQGYGTSAQANGLNWIALSNDALSETTASTTLSNEITLNGLGRAQGTPSHSAGTTTTTIAKTFTASGTQSAQKAALFSASTSGTMAHVLSFTQRNLISGDTLTVTYTITLS